MILSAHAREHVDAGFCVKEEACHRTDAAQRPKQAIMKSHPSQANLRTGRLFFLAAFAFCGAAIATGFCFVYAIQVGLERLAMYHPLAEKPSISGSLHPVTTLLHIFRSLSTLWGRIHVIFYVPAVNPFVSPNIAGAPGVPVQECCGRLQEHCFPPEAGWAIIWMPALCILHCWLMTAGACTIRGVSISVERFCSNIPFCCAADKGKPDPPRALQR